MANSRDDGMLCAKFCRLCQDILGWVSYKRTTMLGSCTSTLPLGKPNVSQLQQYSTAGVVAMHFLSVYRGETILGQKFDMRLPQH